jgi:hypothetical protein
MTNRITTRLPASRLRLMVFGALAMATLAGTLAAPAFADDHDRGRGRNDQRRDWRHDGDNRQPEVYYNAPPVVYVPPGVSINLGFPLYR